MKRFLRLASSLIPLLAPLNAREEWQVCGTHRASAAEQVHLHRQSMRALRAKGFSARAPGAGLEQKDQILVMDSSEGAVATRNPFDLEGRSVVFTPGGAGVASYSYLAGPDAYDAPLAAAGAKLEGLGDDDTRRVTIPFAFSYYGTAWREVWVNSDGNLTFGAGDVSVSARSLGRFVSGNPRIAPLFADLDPSAGGAVRVTASAGVLAVSWVDVPEYSQYGTGPLQRTQVRLYPNGRIEFAWAKAALDEAVTGLAPGRLAGGSTLVSFADEASKTYPGAVAERFGTRENVDIVRVAQRFYGAYEDAYDYLVIFNRMGYLPSPSALANMTPVRNFTRGIGDSLHDYGAEYGSAARLKGVLNMGPLTQYPHDPYQRISGRGTITGDNPMTILGHETGHLWLALASVRDPANPEARPMLGGQNAHWSFNFNSEASLLEGTRIRDNGETQDPRFETVATVEGYAPLDQYLMGFRPPAEVPPSFLVQGSPHRADRLPQTGVPIGGQRRDIAIEEIVAAEGRRAPDHTVAQRRFRMAFILLTPAGLSPSAGELEQLDRYRREFEPYFARIAGARGAVETDLRRAARLSIEPAGGVLAGGALNVALRLEKAAEAALVFTVKTDTALAETPATVPVAAGSREARFTVRGRAVGVADLALEPADARYATARARLQVLGSARDLGVAIEGDLPVMRTGVENVFNVRLRAQDANGLGYAGIRLQVAASAGGSVEPAEAATDESGGADFRWRPGPGPVLQLTARTADNPSAPVVFPALGPPYVAPEGIVDAAGFQPGLSPGSLASLFGFNLWNGREASAPIPWPVRLDGVEVRINDRPVSLLTVGLGQINLLVPLTLAPGVADVVVSTPYGQSAKRVVELAEATPGIFVLPATGRAAARQSGRYVEVYGTGLGAVTRSADDRVERTVAVVSAELNGRPADVLFSGLSPGIPGLYQVNLALPEGLAPGDYPLVIRAGGKTSNRVTLRVE